MDVYLLSLILASLGGNGRMLDLTSSYIKNGGDSLKAIKLASKQRAQGYGITREMILTSASLAELIQAPPVSSSAPESPAAEPVSSPSSGSPLGGSSPETRASDDDDDSSAIPELGALKASGGLSSLDRESVALEDGAGHEGVLTEMQLSMIRGTLSDSSAANMICYQETYHTSDLPAIKAAWAQVIRSEPIFQTSKLGVFVSEDTADFNWAEVPESASSDFEGLAQVATRYKGRIGSFFEAGPSGIGQDGRPLSAVTWVVHHAFIDGYSGHVLFDKVRRLANGHQARPGPSFWNWAQGLKAYQQERKADGDAFWARKRSSSSSSEDAPRSTGELLLPSPPQIRRDAAETTTLSSCINIDLGELLSVDVAACTRDMGLTSAVAFYAAWALVLATYADSDSVVFGAVLGGRSLPVPGSVDVIGPALNVLPLHVTLRRYQPARDLLRSLFRDLLELEDFSWTTPDNGFTRRYESALSVQMTVASAHKTSHHQAIQPLNISTTQVSEVPISITVDEAAQNIKLQYHKRRFNDANLARIAECYGAALKQILLRPDLSVGEVMDGLLSPSSVGLLRRFGNCSSATAKPGSIKQDLVTLFEQRVRTDGSAIAVDDGQTQLSYQDLDLAAGRVADKLLRESIGPGDVVCVHADRSIGWITAIFGVLKAGAVYCPLDSKLPGSLRESMYGLADARAFLASQESQRALLSNAASFSVESILREAEKDGGGSARVPVHRQEPQPSSPAYICFTSGSTGTPKGVLCLHEGLVAFEADRDVRMQAAPGVRIAQIMSVAFDGCVHEIFSSLTYGATLVLPSRPHDPFAALDTAHVAMLTPTSGRVLDPDEYPNLKYVSLVHSQSLGRSPA